MNEFERDLIERGERALRGGYSIALGKEETKVLIEGLKELQRRRYQFRDIDETYLMAQLMELLASRCLKMGVVLTLTDRNIKLLKKAVKLASKRRHQLERKARRKEKGAGRCGKRAV